MGIKEQFSKIKDNWLLILIVLVVLFAMSGGMNVLRSIPNKIQGSYSDSMNLGAYARNTGYQSSSSFAPEETVRKITKTANFNTEVKYGDFARQESNLKDIITASGSYLLNENVNNNEVGISSYNYGSYQIKVQDDKYEAVISELKQIGKIKSFTENKQDITGQYTDAKIEVMAEKARLDRYNSMYEEATLIADKITLNDRIFDQERKIKYMEDALINLDQRVDYSTIYLSMNEKQSEFADIVFVTFGNLIGLLVTSINTLLQLLFVVLPWAAVLGAYLFVKKLLKK